MALTHPTPITFDGPAGRLEGLLGPPECEAPDAPCVPGAPPLAVAILCHPHPAHGGTMHNTVVHRVAKGLRSAGLAVLRFNFRGVEGSEGEHDGNGLEEGDALAALNEAERRYPNLPLWAGGFSFGSRTVCWLAPKEPRIQRALFIALPVSVYDCDPILTVPQKSLLLFAGNDTFGTRTVFLERFGPPPAHFDVQEIAGTDHFFKGKTPQLEESVRAWAAKELESL